MRATKGNLKNTSSSPLPYSRSRAKKNANQLTFGYQTRSSKLPLHMNLRMSVRESTKSKKNVLITHVKKKLDPNKKNGRVKKSTIDEIKNESWGNLIDSKEKKQIRRSKRISARIKQNSNNSNALIEISDNTPLVQKNQDNKEMADQEKRTEDSTNIDMLTKIDSYWNRKSYLDSPLPLQSNNQFKNSLTFRDFQSLKPDNWLNDAVMNEYVRLLNKQCEKKGIQKVFVHSLFSSILTKTFNKIEKALQKLGYKPGYELIFIIYYKSHWFFSSLNDKQITIYDSLQKPNQEKYLKMQPIKLILSLGNHLYANNLQIKICQTYPQQDNRNDCGVITLLGIQDYCKQMTDNWTFKHYQSQQKRKEIAEDILLQRSR